MSENTYQVCGDLFEKDQLNALFVWKDALQERGLFNEDLLEMCLECLDGRERKGRLAALRKLDALFWVVGNLLMKYGAFVDMRKRNATAAKCVHRRCAGRPLGNRLVGAQEPDHVTHLPRKRRVLLHGSLHLYGLDAL